MNNFNFVAVLNPGGLMVQFGYYQRVDGNRKVGYGNIQLSHQFSKCLDGLDLSFLSVYDESQRF